MSIASPLPHPATQLLTGLAVLSSSWPLRAGPAGRLTPLRAPGPAAPRQGSLWSRRLLPPFSSVTSSSLCSWLGSTCTGLPPAPSGSRHDSAVTWRISGHVPSLTPGDHGPTLPHVPLVTSLFPPHVPISSSRPLVTSPLPITNPNPCTLCTVLIGERGSGNLMVLSSKPGVARWHATAFYSKRSAGGWPELSGRRLHHRLELQSKNESFFPAARLTLSIHLRCCARAAERSAGYPAPWKSIDTFGIKPYTY